MRLHELGKKKLTKPSYIDLCDVEEILVSLFEDVANSRMVGNELEWDSK